MPGLVPPTWQQVRDREYAAWPEAELAVDTATTAAVETARRIADRLGWID